MQYRIDLHIDIQITLESDSLTFLVKDNAGGLTKQERLAILDSLESPHTQHGIVNSYKRLSNFFSDVQLDLRSQSPWRNLGQIYNERTNSCLSSLS